MRQSKIEFLERCSDITRQLGLTQFSWHDYKDGCIVDFKTDNIKDVPTLCRVVGNLEFRIFADNGNVIVRVFEDYREY